ncbi:MAG: hydrogenase maturation protease [Tepidisphaeraceae bacterium]|jgi:hydrogenase maturation protease
MPSSEIDAPVLVIGYGNALRGDDGVGPAIAEALRDQLSRSVADVLIVHQLLPELSERLARCRLAIFFDADPQIPPGEIRQQNLPLSHEPAQSIGHHQSPEQLLAMARELYGSAPPAILYRIGGKDFGFQLGLSEPVQNAIPRLIADVINTVSKAARAAEPPYA